MCLIVFDWQPASGSLRLVANRDEFHARPAAPLGFWDDHPEILGGRDLQAGGSWLAVSQHGRLAAITNVREPGVTVDAPLSRGNLVRDFLLERSSSAEFIARVVPDADAHGGGDCGAP